MAKVHFITQGCSANAADSEVMMGILKDSGYEIVNSPDGADIVVYNTCTVKNSAQATFEKNLKKLKNKKVVVAGCIPQGQPNAYRDYSRIGTYQIKKIKEVVDSTLSGINVSFLDRKDEGRLNLPKMRKNNLIEIVPLSMGCLNQCSFCGTKRARGALQSYSIKDIVRHVSKSVENGANEIWLTSQDNAVYGFDIGTNLAELIKSILTIDRDFKIRIGMGNPQHFVSYLDELVKVMKDPRVFSFIHIPLQSGSDKVLKDMNRGYTSRTFVDVVSKIRKKIPNISIMTDIICGFPTETEDDFEETLKIIKETKPDMINYSRYSSRPGTVSSKLKQINGGIIRDRINRLVDLFHTIAEEHNKSFVGRSEKILITEIGKNKSFIGKNSCYKQVVVHGKLKIGQEVDVKITRATPLDLRGVVERVV